jgi:hypothetical protein
MNNQEAARDAIPTSAPAPLWANVPQAGLDGDQRNRNLPAAPVLGGLPLARWIPMDVHSVMDYANAMIVGAGAISTDCPRARIASAVLAAGGIGVSATTDYRLSAAKLIPIEAHEVIDHAWGLAAIAAPFLLGYWKTAPRVALVHVIAGVGNIAASLVTDYRAARGVGRRRQP